MKITPEQIEALLNEAPEEIIRGSMGTTDPTEPPPRPGRTRCGKIGPFGFRMVWFPDREFGVVGLAGIEGTPLGLHSACRVEERALKNMSDWVNHLDADILQSVVDYLRR